MILCCAVLCWTVHTVDTDMGQQYSERAGRCSRDGATLLLSLLAYLCHQTTVLPYTVVGRVWQGEAGA